ncbi:hypothetical protein D3C85_1325700 [compost metagenome]
MAGYEYRKASFSQLTDKFAQLLDAFGVQSVRRFIQNEQPRAPKQRLGNSDPLPHAERIGAYLVMDALIQPDNIHHLSNPGLIHSGLHPGKMLQIFPAG